MADSFDVLSGAVGSTAVGGGGGGGAGGGGASSSSSSGGGGGGIRRTESKYSQHIRRKGESASEYMGRQGQRFDTVDLIDMRRSVGLSARSRAKPKPARRPRRRRKKKKKKKKPAPPGTGQLSPAGAKGGAPLANGKGAAAGVDRTTAESSLQKWRPGMQKEPERT